MQVQQSPPKSLMKREENKIMKKRAKVIMLPNENGIIWSDVGPYDNELALVTKETEHLSGRPRHHLYITTDDKIKELP